MLKRIYQVYYFHKKLYTLFFPMIFPRRSSIWPNRFSSGQILHSSELNGFGQNPQFLKAQRRGQIAPELGQTRKAPELNGFGQIRSALGEFSKK